MKYYKTVILRSTSKSKVNIPKDVWKNLGWKLNDKLRLTYTYNGPSYDSGPVGLSIDLDEENK